MSEISKKFLVIGYNAFLNFLNLMAITISQLIYLLEERPNMILMQKMIIHENMRVAHIPQVKQKYLKYLSIYDNWDTLLSLLILMIISISPLVWLLEERLNKTHGDEICGRSGKRGRRSFS